MLSYENFTQMTAGELKCCLAERALSTSGTKQELVARSFTAMENRVAIVKSDDLDRQIREAYEARWKKLELEADPLSGTFIWNCSDISLWPTIDLGKKIHFIISKKQHNVDIIGHYKTHKAYSYWSSGFVDEIRVCKLQG
jgi:hypothetical protein